MTNQPIRERLLAPVLLIRALLALTLLVGLYVVVALIVAWWAFMAFAAFHGTGPRSSNHDSTANYAIFAAFSAITTAIIVREVIRMSQPVEARADSVPLTADNAPHLTEMVNAIAAKIGTDPPKEIRIVADASVYVADIGPLLGLRSGVRRLYLGAPLLSGMQEPELYAVLAHEIGHLARNHPRFTVPVARGAAAMQAARDRIRSAGRTNQLIRSYGQLPLAFLAVYEAIFHALTRPIRRRQELESDAVAARISDSSSLIHGLESVSALRALWADYHENHILRLRQRNIVPDDPFRAFAEFLRRPAVQQVMEQYRAAARTERAGRRDVHPSIADRASWLSRRPTEGRRPDKAVGVEDVWPLAAGDTTKAGLVKRDVYLALAGLVPPDPDTETWPAVKWMLLAENVEPGQFYFLRVLGPAVRTASRAVLRATRISPPTLGDVLRLLDSRTGRNTLASALVMAAERDAPPSSIGEPKRDELLFGALYALCVHAIISSKSADWTWDIRQDIADRVWEAIRSHADTARLNTELRSRRIDVDAVSIPATVAEVFQKVAPASMPRDVPRKAPLSRGAAIIKAYRHPYVLVPLGLAVVLSLGGALYRGSDDEPLPYPTRVPPLQPHCPLPTWPGQPPAPGCPEPLPQQWTPPAVNTRPFTRFPALPTATTKR